MGSEKIKMELLQSKIVGGGGAAKGQERKNYLRPEKQEAHREEHLLGHRVLQKLHKQTEEEGGEGERGQRKGSD